MTDLTGKHALVTGGGTGIGLAIATSLADAGAQVTITGRRADVLDDAAATHDNLHAATMDVTSEDDIRAAVTAARDARGPITICVANAGIAEGRKLSKTPTELWRKVMAVNLDGVFLTVRECLHDMEGEDWGRVIAISSIAGVKGLKGAGAYSASKHGVIGLIRSLSEDYLGSNLTFNAICPAYVDTDIVSRNVDAIAEKIGGDREAAMAMMRDVNKHKRLIRPEEVAAAAMWMVSPGSESVNGQTIEIAGGQM
ncbi:SDR family oxidoreductase [Maritimibacter sp. UBA3975]|uniref:SDR family NAD(P)-dependent oxidoreductase n=1 Tax=Maritimibacter sp. UBA3975 TaxID=1946833 RepID=UPI000C0BA687|nr:SDR family oxidoreductase [Maritimibacter sp. UBA3975]MAM61676.1 3-hydroxyacyl-CoA dehydrogenase [Maritimibacter sp.]|tara:strand:+ start:4098 stop:4859 length:762 start_codon:yes stop_codon:yes gene_type:complete